MGTYDSSDLYRRQHVQDHPSAPTSSSDRRRALLVPLVVILLGFVLSMWGPLPGLGMFMLMGGVLGLAITAAMVLTDVFS